MRRYYDYNTYLREIYGERVQKIPLDAGLTCPNRDGTLSTEGCLYCDALGSGTGAMIRQGRGIREQLLQGRRFGEKRYGAKKFIAYFQSFSNTYAPLGRLRALYEQALDAPFVVGLSVATRPDCIDRPTLDLLASYQKDHLVWVEYGLQSAHDRTLARINRGHDRSCLERAVRLTAEYGINTCLHIILGLPGEDRGMVSETARYVASLPVQGIKIHSLYVLKGTRLAELYEEGGYSCLERRDYVLWVVDVLERLPPRLVIQRLTGDPPRGELVAPSWTLEKGANLQSIAKALEDRNTWQGRLWA